MERITIITLTIIGLLSSPTVASSSPILLESPASAPAVEIHGGTDSEARLVEDAVGRFGSAGLNLPNLVITVHRSDTECNGRTGLYRSGDEAATIQICQVSDYVVLHELAHAWEVENVSDANRDAFLEASGLETWTDSDVRWADRGRERVANIVATVLRASDATVCGEEKVALFGLISGTECSAVTG